MSGPNTGFKRERHAVAGEQTIVSGMAGRYATALFELAAETNQHADVEKALDAFMAMVAESADLQRLVKSPVFGVEDQTKAVTALLAKAGMTGLAANFLQFVASNRRLSSVGEIIAAYKSMAAQARGEVTANVTVASDLTAAQSKSLAETLKAVLGKEPNIDVKVDPSILGGLVVKVGSKMVDVSLKTKLNSIKTAMKEVG